MLTGEPFKLIELTRTAKQDAKIPSRVYAAVSPEDYPWLTEHRWALNIAGSHRLYAYTSVLDEKGKWKYMGMHRMIVMRAGILDEDEVPDHRNGYGLDNRRCNLRPASRALNGLNRYPFEVIHTEDPFPPPYAPPTGSLLPFGVAYSKRRKNGIGKGSQCH